MSNPYADLIFSNGTVITIDEQQPRAEAVAVAGNRILAVGRKHEIEALAGSNTQTVDLHGQAVLPGFVDAHIHFLGYALTLQQVDLMDCTSAQACAGRVAERAKSTPPGQWIQGSGWTRGAWSDDAVPDKSLLDDAAPNNPVILKSRDWHSVWANSRALHLAGVTVDTPDIGSGVIYRYANGEPSGVFSEDANRLIYRAVTPESPAQREQALLDTIPKAWALGMTGIHEANDSAEGVAFKAFQSLQRQGRLGLRVVQQIPLENMDHALKIGLQTGFGNDWLRVGSIKFFADGALGSRTADMLEPYEGEPNNWGVATLDPEEMTEAMLKASAGGFSIMVHAIGDRANRHVLNSLSEVRRQEDGRRKTQDEGWRMSQLRHRIEHVQCITSEDIPRLAELDIVASMQPIHATSDMYMVERNWGPQRAPNAYAWRKLADLGVRFAFGSDAPVETPDVIAGIHAAVTRRRADGSPGPQGWRGDGRLDMATALHGYTLGAAYVAGQDPILGSITPGKLADLVVLSQDPFTVQGMDILGLQVMMTVCDGRVVYRKS